MAFLRLLMMLLVAQTVVYVCFLLFLRARKRDKMIENYSDHASEKERETFVDAQVQSYMSWLRPRLALVIYVIPIVVISAVIYFTNF